MSDEQQNNIPKNPEPSNTSSSSEEERKKQFEKMKDRFGKKPSNPFGGSNNSGGNGGNSFYWIYGLVIVGLLGFVFFGQDFETRTYEIDQTQFEQNMLAKGDVREIVIVISLVSEPVITNGALTEGFAVVTNEPVTKQLPAGIGEVAFIGLTTVVIDELPSNL
mgnify:CR=1 FL=1